MPNRKHYLTGVATDIIRKTVERLFNGEEGNSARNAFIFRVTKEGWEHSEGFYQYLPISIMLDPIEGNYVSCNFDDVAHISRLGLRICFYKEKNDTIKEKEEEGEALLIPYSEISSFYVTDEMLKKAFKSWNSRWIYNHIAPFAEEALSDPHEWLEIKTNYDKHKRTKDTILGVFSCSEQYKRESMNDKVFLKDLATHLIKDSVKRLIEGERGNSKAVNSFEYKISKEGWKHKNGFYQCFDIDVTIYSDSNHIVCYFDNTGDDNRDRKTSVCFYKEKNSFIQNAEEKKWYGFLIPYSELSSFKITDEMLREAILSWSEKWSNNHIAPFADEAVNKPHDWFLVEQYWEKVGGTEEKISKILGYFNSSFDICPF